MRFLPPILIPLRVVKSCKEFKSYLLMLVPNTVKDNIKKNYILFVLEILQTFFQKDYTPLPCLPNNKQIFNKILPWKILPNRYTISQHTYTSTYTFINSKHQIIKYVTWNFCEIQIKHMTRLLAPTATPTQFHSIIGLSTLLI